MLLAGELHSPVGMSKVEKAVKIFLHTFKINNEQKLFKQHRNLSLSMILFPIKVNQIFEFVTEKFR